MQESLWYKMLNEKQNFLDAERYRWIRDASWEVPADVIAPALVNCNGDMTEFSWLTGDHVDRAVDSWMAKEWKVKK
jgi:hypothetical protein